MSWKKHILNSASPCSNDNLLHQSRHSKSHSLAQRTLQKLVRKFHRINFYCFNFLCIYYCAFLPYLMIVLVKLNLLRNRVGRERLEELISLKFFPITKSDSCFRPNENWQNSSLFEPFLTPAPSTSDLYEATYQNFLIRAESGNACKLLIPSSESLIKSLIFQFRSNKCDQPDWSFSYQSMIKITFTKFSMSNKQVWRNLVRWNLV